MNKVTGCLDGVQWYRTSKQAARNAYNQGEEVLICAVNLTPFGGWRPGSIIRNEIREHSPLLIADKTMGVHTSNDGWETYSFEDCVFNYQWYNCTNTETGKYAAFYLKEKAKG